MSFQNEFMTKVALPLTGLKRMNSDPERMRRDVERRLVRPRRFAPPRALDRRARVSVRHHEGWPVYELDPREASADRHVLYLHGGAYVGEISRLHWTLLGRLVQEARVSVTVPIYPLGAVLGAAKTVTGVTAIAAGLVDRHGTERVSLMGDSAGGGMALAVAQALRNEGRGVHRLVLIAPWLDATTSDPAQREIAPRDAMLAIPGLVEAARIYAGELPLDDPRVSPINGDLGGLAPITVVVGTDDLLHPDSRRLRDACAAVGTPCELIEEAGMQHVYPLLPIPEATHARRRIVELLRT